MEDLHKILDLSVYLENPEDLITLGWSSHLATVDWQKVAAACSSWGLSSSVPTLSPSLCLCTCLPSRALQGWNLEINVFTFEILCSRIFCFRAKLLDFSGTLVCVTYLPSDFKPLSFSLMTCEMNWCGLWFIWLSGRVSVIYLTS